MTSAPDRNSNPIASGSNRTAAARSSAAGSLQRRLIVAGFSISTAVLAALLVLAYWSSTRFVQWNVLVQHTREVQATLEAYTNAVKSAQLAAVSFYTDGSEQQVAAFAASQVQAHKSLERFRELTPDNAAQQHNLEVMLPLSDQALTLLSKLFDLRRAGKTGEAGLAGVNEEAKKLTPPLTAALGAMIAEENKLLETRTTAAAVLMRRTRILQISGGILALLIVGSIFMLFMRESAIRSAAEQGLAKMNAELEQRVKDRTEALEAAVSHALKENEYRLGAEAAVRSLNSELE